METRNIELYEWDSRVFDESVHDLLFSVNDDDYELIDYLNDKNIINIIEKRGKVIINTNSFVGKIKIGNTQIKIKPKIRGDYLFKLLSYVYNLDDIMMFNEAEHSLKNFELADFLVYEYYLECRKLYKYGLLKSYIGKEENLQSIRGKLDMKKIAQNGGLIEDKLPCIFYDRKEDNHMNRTILSGLKYCSKLVNDGILESKIKSLFSLVNESVVCERLDENMINKAQQKLNRLNRIYEKPLFILKLIYDSRFIGFENSSEKIVLNGFLFDMNTFFEELVGKILSNCSDGYKVNNQHSVRGMFKYNTEFNPLKRSSATIRPDFALMKNNKVVRFYDSKYRDLWENNLTRDMLYQLSIYALSGIGIDKSSVIIYPAWNKEAEIQKIDISEPLQNNKIGEVILKPINLEDVAQIVYSENEFELIKLADDILLN